MKRSRNKVINNQKGFTLMELLAVVAILGILMMLAIPLVLRHIQNSKIKSVISSIDSYVQTVMGEANYLTYDFTAENTVYAIPIECIELEQGGQMALGQWMQANYDYWAYVLVQYDSTEPTYNYAFTFKDSLGYSLYPTKIDLIKEDDDLIDLELNMTKPQTGVYTNYTSAENWKNSGFELNETTQLRVLEAESQGKQGDGVNTCTLCQIGSNYEQVEEEKEKAKLGKNLVSLIKENNPIITAEPSHTYPSHTISDASGLYSSTLTNSGNPTLYFRGNVTNNYVSFAGMMWKIIRINEDGSIRIMLLEAINDGKKYKISTIQNNYKYFYYTNSDVAKLELENWYKTNITDKNFDKYITNGTFCQQVKVTGDYDSRNFGYKLYPAAEKYYTPKFTCVADKNGYGIVNSKIGLMSYDEVVFAGLRGSYCRSDNYLISDFDEYSYWIMTPGGIDKSNKYNYMWAVNGCGALVTSALGTANASLRPVINLNPNVTAKGEGIKGKPYVIDITN